jgi:hypothetical protein
VSVVLRTVDQVLGSAVADGPQLAFADARVTARDIVQARVRIEVERYNSSAPEPGPVALFVPAPTERELNGERNARRRPLEPERQIEVALAAVRSGRVIILFNGAQVDDLDAPLMVTPVSSARFLKLLPLVGG